MVSPARSCCWATALVFCLSGTGWPRPFTSGWCASRLLTHLVPLPAPRTPLREATPPAARRIIPRAEIALK
eukprot:5195527-Pleurochrysis_carterae.AAC.1